MTYISAVGIVNALGSNTDETAANLTRGVAPGIRPHTGWLQGHPFTVLASVDDELPAIPQHFNAHHSHNNQLLLAALIQIQPQVGDAITRFGRDRIAVVLGTSTSGLDEGDVHVDLMLNGKESTDRRYPQQELGDPSRFLSHWPALGDSTLALSAACLSSVRTITSGRRLIELGLVDIVIVGSADALSRIPINGFHSLESLSPALYQPFGHDRYGITIGEGATLMVLAREPQPIALLGIGESSDAYHISTPHPQGGGTIHVIGQTLNDTGITSEHVDYVNLHRTTVPLNNQIESNVVSALSGETVPYNSTRHLTGHALGAARITKVAINMPILQCELPLLPQDFSQSPHDGTLPICGIVEQPRSLTHPVILPSSFALGGNNTSILPGRIS